MNRRLWEAWVPLCLLLTSCFGSSKSTVLDGDGSDDANPLYTEVFLDYGGPHAKWAGPKDLVIHLTARNGKEGVLSVTHPNFKSSHVQSQIPIEQAREQLMRLHQQLTQEEVPIVSCSSPMRIRLVRSDGALIARMGCRGEGGWERLASEMTLKWLDLAVASEKKSKGARALIPESQSPELKHPADSDESPYLK